MSRLAIIELTDNEARVLVLLHTKKEALIESVFSVDYADLPREGSADQRGIRLRDALKERRIQLAECGLVIPKQSAILRTAILPSTEEDEVREMSIFEAEKYITFNAERHIVSTAVLRPLGMEGTMVIISAVDGPVIDQAMVIAETASLDLSFAEVSSLSLARAFQRKIDNSPEDSSVLVVDIGRAQTDISIVEGGPATTAGALLAARSQNLGTDKLRQELEEGLGLPIGMRWDQLVQIDVSQPESFLEVSLPAEGVAATETGAEDAAVNAEVMRAKVDAWLQKLARFVRQTVDFSLREQGTPAPSSVHICGEGSLLRGVREAFSDIFGVPVIIADFSDLIPVSPEVKAEPNALIGDAALIGAALRLIEEVDDPKIAGERVNLLPLDVIEARRASERKVLLGVSGFMVLITAVILYLAYDFQARYSEQLETHYKKYARLMAPVVEDLEVKEEQLEIIGRITDSRAGALRILDLVSQFEAIGSERIGGKLTLTNYKYTSRGDVTFEGTASTFEDMQRFAAYIEEFRDDEERLMFSRVDQPQPTPMDLSNGRGSVYKFVINAMLTDFNAEEKS